MKQDDESVFWQPDGDPVERVISRAFSLAPRILWPLLWILLAPITVACVIALLLLNFWESIPKVQAGLRWLFIPRGKQ